MFNQWKVYNITIWLDKKKTDGKILCWLSYQHPYSHENMVCNYFGRLGQNVLTKVTTAGFWISLCYIKLLLCLASKTAATSHNVVSFLFDRTKWPEWYVLLLLIMLAVYFIILLGLNLCFFFIRWWKCYFNN